MRTITYSDNYELVINGERVKLPINTTSQSGCYVEILEAYIEQLVAMLSIHCKVLDGVGTEFGPYRAVSTFV